MDAGVQQPHDKLFRTVFSDISEAESFLRAYLPAALAERLDWTTLTPVETSFVDEALLDSESDLLYTVRVQETMQPVYLYLLFEHQSSSDKWMRFRLLKYMCRIWDESFKEYPEQEMLIPILPLVFYQGKTSWTYSTQFANLFPETEQEHLFVPRFAHHLVDQSGMGPEQIQGALKSRIAQLLMMAAYHEPMRELLEMAGRLLAQVPRTGGINYVKVFVVYLLATQERRTVQEFAETVRRYAADIGGEMLTYAEELRREGRQEGEIKGKIEGKIETIENLLAVGVDWSVITTATGIAPAQFQALKEQLQQLASPQADSPDLPSPDSPDPDL